MKHTYGENHPAVLGISGGFSTLLKRPDNAQGPSGAFPIGAALGYAIEQVPGVENPRRVHQPR